MSYDPKCYDLAQAFLADYSEFGQAIVSDLAQVIQDAIEDFIEEERRARNR